MSSTAAAGQAGDTHALFLVQLRDVEHLQQHHGEGAVEALERQLLGLINRNIHRRDPLAFLSAHVLSFVSRVEAPLHALHIASRLFRLAGAHAFSWEGRLLKPGVGIRMALQQPGEDPLAWMQRAHQAPDLLADAQRLWLAQPSQTTLLEEQLA